MKHHIVIKFLAIALCALTLLGAVGSGLGIFVMTEMDLYQRTVDDAYREYLENWADSLSWYIGARYASRELGQAPEQLIERQYGRFLSSSAFDESAIGYTILDDQGNVLETQPLDVPVEHTFRVPVQGEYAKVLSTMTMDEYAALVAPVQGETFTSGSRVIYDALPEEGADICYLDISYSDGSGESFGGMEILGRLTRDIGGSVEFRSSHDFGDLEATVDQTPVYICFRDANDVTVYEMSGDPSSSVIYTYSHNDSGVFIGLWPVDEKVPELVPIEAEPEEGTPVWKVTYRAQGKEEVTLEAQGAIGNLSFDDAGNALFTSYGLSEPGSPGVQTITDIVFFDMEGTILFAASFPEYTGFLVNNGDGTLYYHSTVQEKEDTVLLDVLPQEGAAITRVSVTYADDYSESTGGMPDIGTLAYEEGHVVFRTEEGIMEYREAPVVAISFHDDQEQLVYEASDPDGVGSFYLEEGELIFRSEDIPDEETVAMRAEEEPAAAAASRTAEETGEVPETTEETGTATEPSPETAAEEVAEPSVQTAAGEETEPSEEAAAAQEAGLPEETAPEAAMAAVTEPPADTGIAESRTTETDIRYFDYYDSAAGEDRMAQYTFETMPQYTVEISFASGAVRYEHEWILIRLVYSLRDTLMLILGVSLLLFAITAVYLCCAAGRKPGSQEVLPAGLNRLPLDAYLALDCMGLAGLAVGGVEGTEYLLRSELKVGVLFALLAAFCASLLIVAFCYACAAQFKTPGGFWWRNSVLGRCVKLTEVLFDWAVKGCAWLWEKLRLWVFPACVRALRWLCRVAEVLLKQLWKWALILLALLKKGCSRLGKAFARFYGLLPVTWQWLLCGFLLLLLVFLAVATRSEGLTVLCICASIAIVIYGAHAFGVLLESAKRMSRGDLDEKVDDKLLIGSFQEFADELNGLADVAVVAAQKQLRSERMKTELITNVSHDIKTPLTSIINYVDLLEKPHTPEEQEIYLEVLSRQSQRLKKLIEDLMEMSKASTGNLTVDITRVDAAEAINQSLGEFADKLEKAQLTAVFHQPEEPVEMMADGRLVWRVMSNLLGNAVKYALPGTRLYVDLMKVDGKVIISMKNISRESLNVSADELLERFVRGDASRNTEGSGLGLNIAQSLMELQKGQLQLLVDGDLFKVTLIFPVA